MSNKELPDIAFLTEGPHWYKSHKEYFELDQIAKISFYRSANEAIKILEHKLQLHQLIITSAGLPLYSGEKILSDLHPAELIENWGFKESVNWLEFFHQKLKETQVYNKTPILYINTAGIPPKGINSSQIINAPFGAKKLEMKIKEVLNINK